MIKRRRHLVRILILISIAGVAMTLLLVICWGASLLPSVIGSMVISGVSALVWVRVARHRRREDNPRPWADAFGFSYQEQAGTRFTSRYPLPHIGRDTIARHVMRGEMADRPLTIFQTRRRLSTKHRVRFVDHTVLACSAPPWPHVLMRPRRGRLRLRRWLGRSTGLLLESPDFNAAFEVTSDDDDFAITLLSREMQEALVARRGVTWVVGHGMVCLVSVGSIRIDRLERDCEQLRRFWEHVHPELLTWENDDGEAGRAAA